MFRMCGLAAVAVALAGCHAVSVPVDVRFAKTEKGYLNSRLDDLGYLYVWNMETGYVEELGRIDLSTKKSDVRYTKLDVWQIAGFDIALSLTGAQKAALESQVSAVASLTLTDARVVSFENTFSDMSQEINRRAASGQDVAEDWFLTDAVRPGSPLRYLLIYRSVTADNTVLVVDKNAVAAGSFTIPTGVGGSVDVKLRGLGSSEFAGDDVTTLVDYYVIKARLGTNPDGSQTYKFRVDDSLPPDLVLSSVLRRL